MFWVYREHHILPSTYYNLGEGEKKILHAFMVREVEDRSERQDAVGG